MTPKVVQIRPDTAECALRALKIDEYGEIERRLSLCAPDVQRLKVLKEEIEGWHEKEPGEFPLMVRGSVYEIQLSPMRNERTVTDKKKAFQVLKRALGLDGLIAVIDFGLGLIDKNVPKSAQTFVSQERSGYRTFSCVAIHAANKAA